MMRLLLVLVTVALIATRGAAQTSTTTADATDRPAVRQGSPNPDDEPTVSRAVVDDQQARLSGDFQQLRDQVALGNGLPIETVIIFGTHPSQDRTVKGVRPDVARRWLTSTESQVRQRIDGPDWRGLQVADFVRDALDKQIRGAPLPVDSGLVSLQTIQRYVDALRSILVRAEQDQAFRITLQVMTNPKGATFELCREYVPTDCTRVGTNVTLADIFRGRYIYKITRAGYHEVKEKLNLVNFSQSRLRCPLRALANPAGAVPCTPE